MSNSAFTPTQIEVTNEVPVNVPVVEATELYTVTVSQGTLSSQRVFKSRSGDRLIIQGNLVFSAGNASTNAVEISLPSGLTADLSKINTGTGALGGSIGSGGILDVSAAKMVSLTAWTTSSTTFGFSVNGSSENLRGTDIGAGDYVNFFVSIPISQWAGSGTTTLATRAVEEYAWNSNTADGSDTTSFGYGPSGVVFGSYTGNRQKTVRFQSAILPTDSLAIEILIPGQTIWQPIQTVNNYASIFVEAGATNYGMRFEPLNSTDVVIIFGSWRKPNSGTYAAAGAPWSDITTTRWRLRKVSSGAQVGYPISTKNIVGATDGVAPVTGMLGERITWVTPPATQTMTSTEADWTNANITLTPGVWLVKANISARASSAAVAGSAGACYIKITDSSNNLIQNSEKHLATFTETNAISRVIGMVSFDFVANISSNTTYKIRAYSNGATAEAIVINASTAWSDFFAIRIA